jgi:hypothetical protein
LPLAVSNNCTGRAELDERICIAREIAHNQIAAGSPATSLASKRSEWTESLSVVALPDFFWANTSGLELAASRTLDIMHKPMMMHITTFMHH